MLFRALDSLERRLVPGPLRQGRIDSKGSEFNSLKQLPGRSCYQVFLRVAQTVLDVLVPLRQPENPGRISYTCVVGGHSSHGGGRQRKNFASHLRYPECSR